MNTLAPRSPALSVLFALFALFALYGLAAEATAAPNAGMHAIGANAQADARGNRALQATLSLPVGQHGWVTAGGGQTRSDQDAVAHSPQLFTGGLGYIGAGWRASLSATQRVDGQAFRQTDGVATLDWQGDVFDVGLDGSTRNARLQGPITGPDGRGGTTTVSVSQTVKGYGLGLRGGVKLGADARLYAGYARYRHRVVTQQNGTAGLVGGLVGDRTLLARALSNRASAVNREEAALSSSVQIGASYRYQQVTLSTEYTGDQAVETPGTTHTALIRAAVQLGPHWAVAPAIGRTRSDVYAGVNFAAVSANYGW